MCPYNYLIDPSNRRSLGIDVRNDIVIIDEAHNIESACRDSASLTLGASVLHEAQEDLLAVAHDAGANLSAEIARAFNDALQFVGALATLLLRVEQELGQRGGSFDASSKLWQGAAIAEMLARQANVGAAQLSSLRDALKVLDKHASDAEADEPRVSQRALTQLRQLLDVLERVVDPASQWRETYRLVARMRARTEDERTAAHERARVRASGAHGTANRQLDALAALDIHSQESQFVLELHWW